MPLAHALIAYQSLLRGLGKLELNPAALEADLEENWAVVAEGIQTNPAARRFPVPYEALKDLTRKNEKITASAIRTFIE